MENEINENGNELVEAADAPAIQAHQAQLLVNYGGKQGELPDPIDFDATDDQIITWATEAAQGGMPGLAADPTADLTGFVVDRFPAGDGIEHNRVSVRPKTPFGA